MSESKYKFDGDDWSQSFRYSLLSLEKDFLLPIREFHYLEIGVFEGRSAVWMLDNYLQHENSTYTGFDLNPQKNTWSNLRKHSEKVTYVLGNSKDTLGKISNQFKYDMIYIDGNHKYGAVRLDSEHALSLIKPNGVILWDDYDNDQCGVKNAVQDFLKDTKINYETIINGYQYGIRVV